MTTDPDEPDEPVSLPEKLLEFCGLFESELLVELMLRFWQHPHAGDHDFRNDLLENAVQVLEESARGQQLMADVPPAEMSLVAAIWYAEWNSIVGNAEDLDGTRRAWCERVRQAVPSCFGPQDRLS